MKFVSGIILAFNCLLFFSCNNEHDLNSLFLSIESQMDSCPANSLAILNEVDVSGIKKEKNRAKYALLLSEALDKNQIDCESDSVILTALNYYSKGNHKEKAKTYYYLGRVYENANNLEASIKAYLDAVQYAKKDDYNLLGLIFSSIGYLYSNQLSLDDALEMYIKASEAFNKAGNVKNLGYTLTCEGWILLVLQDYEKALAKCKEALAIAEQQNDTSQIFTLANYIATNYTLNLNTPQKAKDFLEKIYATYNNNIVPENDYALWGYIHLKEGDLKIAELYIQHADSLGDCSHFLVGYYELNSMLQAEKGNYKEALDFSNRSLRLQDSITKNERQALVQDFERRYKTEALQSSYDLLRTKHHYHVIITILISVLILFIVIFIVKRILSYKKEKEKKIEEYRNFIHTIKEDYHHIQKEYNSLFEYSTKQSKKISGFKNALDDRLSSIKDLIEIVTNSGENTDLFLKRFKKYISLESGKNTKLFTNLQELVNLHYNGVIDYLKNEYPLSNEDLNFCCLIYLKIPVNGIQLMCNYTNMDSLYNRRYKIRQRMKLSSGVNLDHFLEELVEKLPVL